MALVLIIEDNPQQRDLYQVIIEMVGGHRTEVIADGTTGMERMKRQPPPDVVMLDMHLPGVSGMEIFEYIRQKDAENKTRTPVFVVTGDMEKANEYRQKADRCWLKPDVPATEVLTAVEECLASQGKGAGFGPSLGAIGTI